MRRQHLRGCGGEGGQGGPRAPVCVLVSPAALTDSSARPAAAAAAARRVAASDPRHRLATAGSRPPPPPHPQRLVHRRAVLDRGDVLGAQHRLQLRPAEELAHGRLVGVTPAARHGAAPTARRAQEPGGWCCTRGCAGTGQGGCGGGDGVVLAGSVCGVGSRHLRLGSAVVCGVARAARVSGPGPPRQQGRQQRSWWRPPPPHALTARTCTPSGRGRKAGRVRLQARCPRHLLVP